MRNEGNPLYMSIRVARMRRATHPLDLAVGADADLDIRAGTTIAFVGKSGAGKSTLIKLFALQAAAYG